MTQIWNDVECYIANIGFYISRLIKIVKNLIENFTVNDYSKSFVNIQISDFIVNDKGSSKTNCVFMRIFMWT